MTRFWQALGFLTVLPVPGSAHRKDTDLGRCVVFFPVIAVIIGLAAFIAAEALASVFPVTVTAALCVALLVAASGALHMDGLADTADGFLSSRPRERILEIMKDSHIGVMGVTAVTCVLVIKTLSLASLEADGLATAAFLMPVAGRCGLVVGMSLLGPARPEEGLGKTFLEGRKAWEAIAASLLLIGLGVLVKGYRGLAAALAALAVVWLFSFWCKLKIGGATGDTLGASCELGETVVALVFTASLTSP
jgi:adenosylcobinamide-GDP ribazoletransferase